MGACDFTTKAKGKTAKGAFDSAVSNAQHQRGHGGYTGTIAEKSEFVMMGTAKTKEEAFNMVDQFMRTDDSRIEDKWGPAGCIEVEDGTDLFVFFGYASS